MTTQFSIHDEDFARSLGKSLRIDPQVVRQLQVDVLKHRLSMADSLANFSPELASKIEERLRPQTLEIKSRHDSQQDGASKLILRTRDGFEIETVILRVDSGRTSLCVSSQVGCAAGCVFCATGEMGISRNLSRDEILDQVLLANEVLAPEERSIRNVVFMGMGEPFHNEEQVFEAVARLTAPRGFGFSTQKVLVSTVGEIDAMIRFATRFPAVNLALSLHSARDEVRSELVPQGKRTSVAQLKAAVLKAGEIRQRPTMIEYVMLADRNDQELDFEALHSWLDGLDVHVNLIPFNEVGATSSLKASSKAHCQEFAQRLKDRGFRVTLRYSLGADIAAACGQLVKSRTR